MDENLIKAAEDAGAEIEVGTQEEIIIEVDESMGWTHVDNTSHYSLSGRDEDDQHPITSITGLRNELDQIKALKTVFSDKNNVANYYEWKDGAYDETGYFVSVAQGTSAVKICEGTNILGVTVDSAGFVGGQSEISRDNSYCLVATSGIVDVRCELDVDVGDCVVSNGRGCAKKSSSNYGYKVLAREKKRGVEYAVISLGVQADKTDMLGVELDSVEKRVRVNEQNIVSAVNVANQAYNKSSEAASISEEAVKQALEAALSAKTSEGTVNNMNDALVSVSRTSAQAKAIAQGAVTSAERIRKEAVDEANKAVKETVKLREDFEAIADNMNENIGDAVKDLENLQKDLEPLAVWPEGSGIESATGYAGFVARADENSSILGAMVGRKGEDGETLAGFIQEAEDTRATVRSIVSYKYVDANGNKIDGAAGLTAQVDATTSEVSAIANRQFTKNDGTIVTGLAGLNAYVNENESNVALVTDRVACKYTVVKEKPGESEMDTSLVYYQYYDQFNLVAYSYYDDGEWKLTLFWDDVKNNLEKGAVYYNPPDKLYWYYNHDNDSWESTTDPHEAGLPRATAGIQAKVDDNSSTINSLTSWQGATDTAMTRIEQKADANGAYIQSTVVNIDRYNVGPSSQANGFTIEQAAEVLDDGIIYVPTISHTEEYKIANEAAAYVVTIERDVSKVYYNSTLKLYYYYAYDDSNKIYTWRTTSSFDEIPKCTRSFTPGYLYKWGRLKDNGQYGWTTVDKDYSEIKNINDSTKAVYFNNTEIRINKEDNNDNYGYWYTNVTDNDKTIYDVDGNATTKYEPYTLYKWDLPYKYTGDGGKDVEEYHWVAVDTLASNSTGRAISQIRQDANSIELRVTNAESAYAGIIATVEDDHSKISSIASWPTGEGTHNMAVFEQKADGDGTYMTLAAVRNVNGEPKIEELGGAKIVLSDDSALGSYIQLDADKINFTSDDYSVLSKNITFSGDQISFTAGNMAMGWRNFAHSGVIFHDDITVNDGFVNTDTKNGWNLTKAGFYNGTKIDKSAFEAGHTYTLSYFFKGTGGKLVNIGGHSGGTTISRVVLDDKLQTPVDTVYSNCIALDEDGTESKPFKEHRVILTFTVGDSGVDDQGFYIQPNRGKATRITYDLWNIKLEKGELATGWIPAIEDQGADAQSDSVMSWKMTPDKCVWWNNNETAGTNSEETPLMRLDSGGLYIKGEIEATKGKIGGWTIKSTYIGSSQSGGSIYITSVDDPSDYWIRTCNAAGGGGNITFSISKTGKLYARGADIGGEIKATGGTIGNWSVGTPLMLGDEFNGSLYSSVYTGDHSKCYTTFMRGVSNATNIAFGVKCNKPVDDAFSPENNEDVFYVRANGQLYAKNAEIEGKITSSEGEIGGFTIKTSVLTRDTTDINGTHALTLGENISIKTKLESGKTFSTSFGWSVGTKIIDDDVLPIYGISTNSYLGFKPGDGKYGYLLGTWYVGAVGSSTQVTSDRNKKNSIRTQGDEHSRIFDRLNPVTFKYNDGTSDRIHTGFIAQEVEDAVIDSGLTTKDFAAVCYDVDEGGNKINYGIRYEEIVSMNTWQIQKLKARVAELEAKIATLV